MKHWAVEYVGIPWKLGGQSVEEGLDCWGIFRKVQKEHYGIDVPEVILSEYTHRRVAMEFKNNNAFIEHWKGVDTPRDGDAVMLKMKNMPSHIGVYIDDTVKGILHSSGDVGAMFTYMMHINRCGWEVSGYYRYG